MGARTRTYSAQSGLQLESVQRTQIIWLGIKILQVSAGRVAAFALSSDVGCHCIHVDKFERFFVVLVQSEDFLSREACVTCAVYYFIFPFGAER